MYFEFKKTIPFPKVGFWVPPKPKPSSTSAQPIDTTVPSYATRSRDQPKRQKTQSTTKAEAKRIEDVTAWLLSLAPEPSLSLVETELQDEDSKENTEYPRRLSNEENKDKAQTGRLLAIASWNSKRFDTSVSLDRLTTAREYDRGDVEAPWNEYF